MTDFNSLKLAEPLNYALKVLGYDKPTPIQAKAIPIVMEGHDLMGLAQTGTGKTAAFSLPALHHLCNDDVEPPKKGTRVLILAPTRELVGQIAESVTSYGRMMPHLSVVTVYGGVPIARQIKKLSGGCDVIVATPGRLIDLLDRGSVKLGGVEMLVLDEADQMMDMGFIHALKKIVPLLPKKRQTLLFSATMVPKIKRLSEQFLTNPKSVSVSPPNSTASKVEQRATFATKAQKLGLLALCLLEPEVTRAIVFTRTKHGADRVVKNLRNIGIDSRAIHGNKSQSQRNRALEAFRSDAVKVMVATDVAARGIDIPEVSHVFNYEIPNVAEQYVHRIGRTGRANLSGVAHAFIDPEEKAYLKDIQKLLKKDIPKVALPENFEGKVRALKSRPAIPAPAKPEPQARKGRGKGRGKPRRGSNRGADRNQDRGGQSEQGPDRGQNRGQNREQGAQASEASTRPDRAPRRKPKGNSDSQDRSRQQARSGGEERSRKPRTQGDQERVRERSENRSDNRGKSSEGKSEARPNGNSNAGFKRKPRKGNRSPHAGGGKPNRGPSGSGEHKGGEHKGGGNKGPNNKGSNNKGHAGKNRNAAKGKRPNKARPAPKPR